MRILAIISALIIFELALVVISPAMDENQNALDLPMYKNDSEYAVAAELNEENISDDQTVPEIETNMYPFLLTMQLPNSCSGPFEKSVELYKTQRYDEAISSLNETIKICPYSADAWYDRGYIEFKLKRYNESLDDFSKAIELDPKDPKDAEYWMFKGIVLLELKRYNDALSAFNISLNINPNLPHACEWKDRALESQEI